jgi:ElaB/YqjD/DUF883 family membrane-anchored ribosome-binding protein
MPAARLWTGPAAAAREMTPALFPGKNHSGKMRQIKPMNWFKAIIRPRNEIWEHRMKQPSLREEIAALRAEVEQLHRSSGSPNAAPDAVTPPSDGQPDNLHKLLGELGDLVQTMLDEAEESVAEHPVASVSAALALGIVIGRLTAK